MLTICPLLEAIEGCNLSKPINLTLTKCDGDLFS
jgi:hypothetical protein